jgi:tetratricopeptide (TPR) repeat protein
MATPALKLVAAPRREEGRSAARALGLLALLAMAVGTWRGADRARIKLEVRERAEAAVELALSRGSADPEVQATLVDLRRTLGWRPLESKTRVVYASLILGLATSLDDLRLAAFHAGRAAELAPVTASVVRAAALVLAHAGETARALDLIRTMFGYEPARAATTLAEIESLVLGVSAEQGIPDAPEAWMAWSRRLAQSGREDEARAWIERTLARWPAHVPARHDLAARAFGARDWEALAALLPSDLPLPRERAGAALHAWRAHLRLAREERTAALADAEAAIALEPDPWVRALAGDVFEALGEIERARGAWHRALHETGAGPVWARRRLLVRLARLEEGRGKPAAALRHWQALLALDPHDAEAQRRVDDLSGFHR